MLTTLFYLRPNNLKDRAPIWVRLHPGNVRLSTGLKVFPKNWNHDSQKVSSREPFYQTLNNRLQEIQSVLFKELVPKLAAGNQISKDHVQTLLFPGIERKAKPQTIAELYEQYYKDYLDKKNKGNTSGKVIGEDSARRPKQVVTHIENFQKGAKPKDITPAWVEKYVEYIFEETGITDNTLSHHIKALRLFLKLANLPYEWLARSLYKSPPKYDLLWPEILQLYTAEYSKPAIKQAAEAMVFLCLVPLRWGDATSLQPHHLVTIGGKPCIERYQAKTGAKVIVPMPPLAAEIWERYGGSPINKVRKGEYVMNSKFNELVKEAAKEAKLTRPIVKTKIRNGHREETAGQLWEKVSSHTGRHTAASRIYEASKNRELSRLLLGHSGKDTTDIYLHYDPVQFVTDILQAWDYFK